MEQLAAFGRPTPRAPRRERERRVSKGGGRAGAPLGGATHRRAVAALCRGGGGRQAPRPLPASMAGKKIGEADIEDALRERLAASFVAVVDTSGG